MFALQAVSSVHTFHQRSQELCSKTEEQRGGGGVAVLVSRHFVLSLVERQSRYRHDRERGVLLSERGGHSFARFRERVLAAAAVGLLVTPSALVPPGYVHPPAPRTQTRQETANEQGAP